MAECVKCGAFTKFKGGFCSKCFSAKDVNGKQNDVEVEEKSGLTDKDWVYRYNMIKGRIAETLIQELF